jgi:AraC family transcriptional regulator of adaptative response / methylphosphotriester-DNA alkyltransferase methyltransferase
VSGAPCIGTSWLCVGGADRRAAEPLGGTTHVSSIRKQLNINAPGIGTVWDDSGVARRKTNRRRKQLLTDAERVIRERHSEFDLSLTHIADDLGCSTRQLQRVFRELGDTDFRSFLLRMRMEQAHRLLSRKKDGLTVRATARAVGYREASGLRQTFVRFYGYNPSEIQNTETDADYDRAWREAEKGDQ